MAWEMGEATESELEAGGRTAEQILEEMNQHPGPIGQYMKKVQSAAVSKLKQAAKDTMRSYFNELVEAAKESGFADEVIDELVSNEFGNVMDEMADGVADVSVNGLTKEEQDARFAEQTKDSAQAQNDGTTYVPDSEGMNNIQNVQYNAAMNGQSSKNLTYTEEMVAGMSQDDLQRAAMNGFLSDEMLDKYGFDKNAIAQNLGLNFGAGQPTPYKVVNVDKIKVLPEYAPHQFKEAEGASVVTSRDDMEKLGDDEFFQTAPDAKKTVDALKDVTEGVLDGDAVKVAGGVGDLLASARAKEADEFLGLGDGFFDSSKEDEDEDTYTPGG